MAREIDPRIGIAILAIIVIVLGIVGWRMWASPSGLRSPKQAGLGRPMKPGEIPGRSSGAPMPITGPPR